jgi:hypothetical protein
MNTRILLTRVLIAGPRTSYNRAPKSHCASRTWSQFTNHDAQFLNKLQHGAAGHDKNVGAIRAREIVCKAKNRNSVEDVLSSITLENVLPVLGTAVLVSVMAPIIGLALPSVGIVIGAVAFAGVSGLLDRMSAVYGISPLNAAAAVAGLVFGILAIPAFLKLGFFLVVGLFLVNLVAGGIDSPSESVDIDASNAIIDVDYESVDD